MRTAKESDRDTEQEPSVELGSPTATQRRSLEEVFGVAALAALVLITLTNVLVRYLTDRSFAWTEEMSKSVQFSGRSECMGAVIHML